MSAYKYVAIYILLANTYCSYKYLETAMLPMDVRSLLAMYLVSMYVALYIA